jgi:hypothetical protein
MKRKFKQWWSTIPPISTKLTIYYHLSPQIIEHKKKHHDNGIENHIIEFLVQIYLYFFRLIFEIV